MCQSRINIMREKIFIMLFLQILVISCRTKESKHSKSELPEGSGINIRIKEDQIVGELLPIEAYIHNIIPLETNRESVIGNCYKLSFTGDKILLLDAMNIRNESSRSEVLMFDTSGKFIQTVGSRGKGPEEYGAPLNLQIGQNGEIQVYCNHKSSILSYSGSGQFLTATKLPYRTPYFAPLDSGNFIVEYNPRQSEFQIGIYNRTKDTTSYFLPFSDCVKNNFFGTSLNTESGFTKFRGHYYFCPQKSNKIYELVDGKPSIKYFLDIAGLDFYFFKRPKDLSKEGINSLMKLRRTKSDGADQLEKITYLQSDGYDKFNFSFNWQSRLYTILREKKSGRIIVGTTQSKTRNNLKEVSNQLLFYANTTYDGKFVAVINTEQLKNLSNIYHRQSLEVRNQLCNNYTKLKEIADSRDEISNPVLVVFSLRETNSTLTE